MFKTHFKGLPGTTAKGYLRTSEFATARGTTPPDRRGSLHGHQEPPAFLTPAEAAAVLGLSRSSIYRLADEGKLPAFRTPGGCLRIPTEAIRDMVG